MHLTPEQAVYSAAFTQALAVCCDLQREHGGGLTYHHPTDSDARQARVWAENAVKAWHTAHETPGFERF